MKTRHFTHREEVNPCNCFVSGLILLRWPANLSLWPIATEPESSLALSHHLHLINSPLSEWACPAKEPHFANKKQWYSSFDYTEGIFPSEFDPSEQANWSLASLLALFSLFGKFLIEENGAQQPLRGKGGCCSPLSVGSQELNQSAPTDSVLQNSL